MSMDMKKGFINLAKGAAAAVYQAIMLIIIPIFTFDYIRNIQLAGISVGMTPEGFEKISFYIVNIGLIVVALAFFSASSPKRTIRKGIVNILKIFFNAIYIWSYKFSGATVVVLDFVTGVDFSGRVTIDFTTMAFMVIGVVFLNIILAIIDIIDWGFFPDEEKQKEAEKYRKTIEKTTTGEKKPLNLPTLKKESGVKVAEDIKLSSKPELAKLKPVDEDFLNKPIEEFKKPGSDKDDEPDLDSMEADNDA